MYINTLKINLSDTFIIDNAEQSISWKVKADMVDVVNNYIKQKTLTEIVKTNDGYSVTWKDNESFQRFILEDLYLNLVDNLKELGVFISWKE
jgi:hypothetical protein